MQINDVPSTGHDLDCVYAYVVADDTGEGICAVTLRNESAVPLVAASLELLEGFRPYVDEIGRRSGKTVRLVRWDHRVVLDEF